MITTKPYIIEYNENLIDFFTPNIGVTINSSNIIEEFNLQSEAITRLLGLEFNTFNVPIALTGMDIENILRVPFYEDNILVRYENGNPIIENNVLTGYTEKQNPGKEYFAEKYNWITKEQLKKQDIEGYIPTDYIFQVQVETKNVKKNSPLFDLATSINNQKSPAKKNKEVISGYVIYLDTDLFSLDVDGTVIIEESYREYITLKQLTKNLIVNLDDQIVENI